LAFRPNFTEATIQGDDVRLAGVSDDDTSDVVEIRVLLVQGERIGEGSVDKATSVWRALVPVEDPDGEGADFQPGPAVAFGAELREPPSATFTWAETLTIE
jgi:hypothetical protein